MVLHDCSLSKDTILLAPKKILLFRQTFCDSWGI